MDESLPDFRTPDNELDRLDDERDILIADIAALQTDIGELAERLDRKQVELHQIELRIREVQRTLRKETSRQ